jgi:hypothetical protein
MSLLIVGSYSKRMVDFVRLRKSPPRGCVDMQAIVSAICARAGHELCASFFFQFPFSMFGHAPVTARAPPCEKAAASLSGYTSKGILTINEARAALGRAPLAEASANRPMTLTNAGFVALPE